ncbi:hypothetical protein, partial [Erwinia typographi]|uniref:hypothetical protein n=1 Tax=Erwinia typographi TaxID=371042 RepID=UPI0012EE42B2
MTVWYTLIRSGSSTALDSDTVAYTVSVVASLPAPAVAEADSSAMTVDPAAVTAGITVKIPAAAELSAGDTVTASVQTETDGIKTTADHTVTAAEAGKALSLVVKETLAGEADGDAVTVWYTLIRSGGSTALDSDTVAYTVSVVASLPAPTVAEADSTAMTVDPAAVTAGITVKIPAAAE